MTENTIEHQLLLKLLETGHLNVPERKQLPAEMLRLSSLCSLIESKLKSNGWFPGQKQFPIGDAGGEYLQLQYIDEGQIILHQNSEYSLYKYQHSEKKIGDVIQAIEEYVRLLEKSDLDGLAVNWME